LNQEEITPGAKPFRIFTGDFVTTEVWQRHLSTPPRTLVHYDFRGQKIQHRRILTWLINKEIS
jgi:hypothetical protein